MKTNQMMREKPKKLLTIPTSKFLDYIEPDFSRYPDARIILVDRSFMDVKKFMSNSFGRLDCPRLMRLGLIRVARLLFDTGDPTSGHIFVTESRIKQKIRQLVQSGLISNNRAVFIALDDLRD